jgi:hypothetical protein
MKQYLVLNQRELKNISGGMMIVPSLPGIEIGLWIAKQFRK